MKELVELDLAGRLVFERKKIGLTQAGMGDLAGVTSGTQSNYEAGKRSPDGKYFSALAAEGFDVQYIISGIRAMPPTEDLTPQECALLEKYRLLSSSDKTHMHAVTDAFVIQSTIKKVVN